jgi:hypothetical protein
MTPSPSPKKRPQPPKAPPPDAATKTNATVPIRADGPLKYVDIREAGRVRLVLADGAYMDVEVCRDNPDRLTVRGFPGPIVVYPDVSNVVQIGDGGT